MKDLAQSASTTILPAPVAAGMMMRGSNFTFGTAPVRGCQTGVRITGRQIWAACGGDGTTTKALVTYMGSLTSPQQTLTFDPDDTKTMPTPLTSLAQCFARYCLRKCRVIYTPSSATSSGLALAMSVRTDAGIAPTATNFIGVMEDSNAAAGPVWSMFSIDVPCDETLRYTTQSVSDASLSVAEERQDHAFLLNASYDSSGTSAQLYGYIHIEYVCDFYEVISQANETSLRKLEIRVAALRSQLASGPRQALVVREIGPREERKVPAASLEDSPQGSLSGGWNRVPTVLVEDPRLTVSTERAQRTGLVKSQSVKG